MTDPYQITFNSWNEVAQLYEDRFMDLELYNDSYDEFCDRIRNPDAAILEIGCGPGNITKYLLSKRPDYKILAIDVSENMIRLAEANNPKADFQIMDCRNIDQINQNFDGIMCGFCIPYLKLEDCMKLVHDSCNKLKPGGILYLSFMEGNYDHSGFEVGSTGKHQMFIYYYEENRMKQILELHKFTIKVAFTKNLEELERAIPQQLIFIAERA